MILQYYLKHMQEMVTHKSTIRSIALLEVIYIGALLGDCRRTLPQLDKNLGGATRVSSLPHPKAGNGAFPPKPHSRSDLDSGITQVYGHSLVHQKE